MSPARVHRASPEDLGRDPGFRALLASASDASGGAFDELVSSVRGMDLLVVPGGRGGGPVALVLYRRLDGVAVEIEYLAVDRAHRHTGMATALVQRVQQDTASMVVARTDGDAIGFYRAAGFQTSDSVPDPRWPLRRRYLCVLPRMALLRELEADSGSLEWVTGSPTAQPVQVVPARAAWSQHYAALADRLGDALGAGALAIDHLGSTSVHGLDAKPVIDVVLTVPDPDDEALYVPLLEAAGFVLRLREPRWYRHRLLVPAPGSGLPAANIHVFAPGSPETSRMLAFRDWLRTHEADRDAYARIKRAAAAQINDAGGGKGLVMDYNAAKEPFILQLYERILHGHRHPGPAT